MCDQEVEQQNPVKESAPDSRTREEPTGKSLGARLAGAVGRQVAGALEPGGSPRSVLGQVVDGLLLNGNDEDDEEDEGGGGGGDGVAGAAADGDGAAVDQILSTIACSAVQGLRRAAAATSLPVKAFWILMVLLSIALFVRGTVTLSGRLANVRVEKSFQLDKVPFLFPDLYFCPSNSYSGSFPFALDEAQAELLNREVDRLSGLFDQQLPDSGFDYSSKTRVWLIQQSMPVHLLKEFVMHRPEQSLFYTPMISNSGDADFQVVHLPGAKICFKVSLTEHQRSVLSARRNGEDLRLALFTDPFVPGFNYSGYPILPIGNPRLNESIPFRVWYPSGIVNMMGSGYTMLIVPQGVYPSMEHETRFKLSPGKSYDIDIQMEEHRFSSELWGSHCSPDHENAAFADHLTGERREFNYSYDACYYTEFARSLHRVAGYIQQGFPVAWDLRDSPRWGNLSENPRINRSTVGYGQDLTAAYAMADPTEVCRQQKPCVLRKYTAASSFHRWPNMGGSNSRPFRHIQDAKRQPALYQLAKIARDLDTGMASTESGTEFRHIVADTMLEVRIRAQSPLAAQVVVTASYTVTSFLSDLGGLMGLYLGCSALTLFELLELLYLKAAAGVAAKRRRRRRRRRRDSGDPAPSSEEERQELDNVEAASSSGQA